MKLTKLTVLAFYALALGVAVPSPYPPSVLNNVGLTADTTTAAALRAVEDVPTSVNPDCKKKCSPGWQCGHCPIFRSTYECCRRKPPVIDEVEETGDSPYERSVFISQRDDLTSLNDALVDSKCNLNCAWGRVCGYCFGFLHLKCCKNPPAIADIEQDMGLIDGIVYTDISTLKGAIAKSTDVEVQSNPSPSKACNLNCAWGRVCGYCFGFLHLRCCKNSPGTADMEEDIALLDGVFYTDVSALEGLTPAAERIVMVTGRDNIGTSPNGELPSDPSALSSCTRRCQPGMTCSFCGKNFVPCCKSIQALTTHTHHIYPRGPVDSKMCGHACRKHQQCWVTYQTPTQPIFFCKNNPMNVLDPQLPPGEPTLLDSTLTSKDLNTRSTAKAYDMPWDMTMCEMSNVFCGNNDVCWWHHSDKRPEWDYYFCAEPPRAGQASSGGGDEIVV